MMDGGNVDGPERTASTPEDKINLVSQNQALELQLAQRTKISANACRYTHSLEDNLKDINPSTKKNRHSIWIQHGIRRVNIKGCKKN